MQVSVEKTSELSRKMTVSVPEEVVQQKIAERLKTIARQVKIDGFRPGKVPQHVVNKMYADKVRGEITGDLIQSTYYEALQNHDLRPAGYPHILPADEAEGFKYTAEFEVYPDISLTGMDQLEVTRFIAEVTETDVDDMIEKLRAQKKIWQAIERESKADDKLTINFTGIADGENFTDGKVQDFQVEIGAKKMIPGFEEQLIGLKAGDNKQFSVNFPADYGNVKLAGKAAEFEVEIIKVEAAALPEVDEAFIKAYGVEEASVNTFREDVRNNMERELEQALRSKLKNAVMDALYEKIPISVPKTLVDQEINHLMEPYKQTAKRQKINMEDLKLPNHVFEEQAKKRVALGLILAEIIQQNALKLDVNKVRSTIEDMAKSYERPEDVVNWYYADEKRLTDVQQMVLEDQTIDWLVTQSKVKDTSMSFSEAMDKR
jgi:trigger factor